MSDRVTRSSEWEHFLSMVPEDVVNEILTFIMLKFLTDYVPVNFVNRKWKKKLIEAYRKRKLKAGKKGHADLIFGKTLFKAATKGAVKSMVVKDRTITVSIDPDKVPYAGVHFFGGKKTKTPKRNFWDLDIHMDSLVEDLENAWDEIFRKAN